MTTCSVIDCQRGAITSRPVRVDRGAVEFEHFAIPLCGECATDVDGGAHPDVKLKGD